MKRREQLKPLSMEHHLSLALANKTLKTVRSGDSDAMAALARQIANEFPERWDQHFRNEEETLFQMLEALDEGPKAMIEQLREEHDAMRQMAQQFAQGNTGLLATFGEMLRDHTRLEERELFPLAEQLLTDKQLDQVLRQTIT